MKKILRRVPRFLVIAAILLALLTVSALAYLSASGGLVKNIFTPAEPKDPSIEETFKDNVKTNVKVNVGNPGYAVYVRAVIVATWESADGIHATAPVLGTDYTLDLNTDAWFEHGGFYYHKAMVNSNGSTAVLITECKLKDGATIPDDYHLSVKIVAQTIQALGTTDVADEPYTDGIPAVQDAWGIQVGADKKLIDPST